MTQETFRQRYDALAHAVQSGIAHLLNRPEGAALGEPKHLRVGIAMCHVTDHAIAELLIQKGVFTEDEYFAQQLKSLEAEVARYEAELSELMGVRVKLG